MNKNEQGVAHVAVLAVAILAVAGSVGIFIVRNKDEPKQNTSNSQKTEQVSNLTNPLPSDLLSAEKVKELVAKETSNAALTSVELENEEGSYVYKVKLANGTILFFDAKTGAKVTHDKGETETEDGEIPAGFIAKITFDQARVTALKQKPDGTISKIELESEEGKIVYSVRFSDKARIDVDATTGEIVRTKSAEKTTTKTPETENKSSNTSSSKPPEKSSSTTSSNSTNDSSSSDDSPENEDDSDEDEDSGESGRNRGSGGGSQDD